MRRKRGGCLAGMGGGRSDKQPPPSCTRSLPACPPATLRPCLLACPYAAGPCGEVASHQTHRLVFGPRRRRRRRCRRRRRRRRLLPLPPAPPPPPIHQPPPRRQTFFFSPPLFPPPPPPPFPPLVSAMAPTLRALTAAAAVLAAVAAVVAVAAPCGAAAAATPTPTPTPRARPSRTPLPGCSGSRCTAYGPGTRCATAPAGGAPTTCRAYAAANGTCTAIADACVDVACDGTALVAGSDGSIYCNWCTLTAASCETGFRVYKVALPTPQPFASPSPVPAAAAPPAASAAPAAPAPTVAPPTGAPAGGSRGGGGLAPPKEAPAGRRPRAGADGCSVLPAGTPARQRFPPYSDAVCDVDYTLCEVDGDCGAGPDGKRMACVPIDGCAASRCGRMTVSASRAQCEGGGRCTRDCRQNVGVCTPVFCA
ncbi:hypothetical protein I4F81_002773 [Pyropia yezoensis]|uniref:Uncharacterized protein n=1 Tax=Pyropia yezoensis TaxID=2788 RepID=A0ACC3BR93_PYRYE|nr:hypothetical protein I4F81_002773 [Neopyropia yezoensis]